MLSSNPTFMSTMHHERNRFIELIHRCKLDHAVYPSKHFFERVVERNLDAGIVQNDIVSKPVLDLFAEANGKYVLMTRDHIIPRSLGGINDVKNLRVGCQPCNSARGNSMNEEDLKFMEEHPELIKTREKV